MNTGEILDTDKLSERKYDAQNNRPVQSEIINCPHQPDYRREENSNTTKTISDAFVLYESKGKLIGPQNGLATSVPAACHSNLTLTKIKENPYTVPATPSAVRTCQLEQIDHLSAAIEK